MADQPQQRGFFGALLDRFVARSAGLPPERSTCTVQPVTIPIEDDISLTADLYQPILSTTNSENPLGTILVMTPYGRRLPFTLNLARIWAARGYVVVLVSIRGTYGSDGVQDPGRSDVVDGPLVVRWMRTQPWYTGTFATMGMSYLAFVQFALINSGEELDDMVAAICMCGMDDMADLVWGATDGALWLSVLDWAAGTIHPSTKKGMKHSSWTDIQGLWRFAQMARNSDGNVALKRSVPLLDGVQQHFGYGVREDAPGWLMKMLRNSDIKKDDTGYWKPMRHGDIFAKIKIPTLLISGWQDIFTIRTLDQFQQLSQRGCDVGLTVGPWNHMEAPGGEGVVKESFDWLEHYLAKKTTVTKPVRQAPVRINVTGVDEWRWLPSWPPSTRPLELHLDTKSGQNSLKLSEKTPTKTDQASFTFDPHDPTPSIGGPSLFGGGYVDDSALAKRTDVLAFDTPPLEHDIEVLGRPHVELSHNSDNPHVDIFLRLCEVDHVKGSSRNISQVYKRLDPDRGQSRTKIELDLSDCAHHFRKGTSIRLLVAGGAFPLYRFNLGTGEDQMTGSVLRPARHTVHIGGSGGSKIVLPVSLE